MDWRIFKEEDSIYAPPTYSDVHNCAGTVNAVKRKMTKREKTLFALRLMRIVFNTIYLISMIVMLVLFAKVIEGSIVLPDDVFTQSQIMGILGLLLILTMFKFRK